MRGPLVRATRNWGRRRPIHNWPHGLIGARLGMDAWRAWKYLSSSGAKDIKWAKGKFLPGNTPRGPVKRKRTDGFSGLTPTQKSSLRKRKYHTPTGQMSEDLQRKIARHGKYRAHKLSRNRLTFATPF